MAMMDLTYAKTIKQYNETMFLAIADFNHFVEIDFHSVATNGAVGFSRYPTYGGCCLSPKDYFKTRQHPIVVNPISGASLQSTSKATNLTIPVTVAVGPLRACGTFRVVMDICRVDQFWNIFKFSQAFDKTSVPDQHNNFVNYSLGELCPRPYQALEWDTKAYEYIGARHHNLLYRFSHCDL